MSEHTKNLESNDPRQKIFAVQDKVLKAEAGEGPPPSDQEIREAVEALRASRSKATSTATKSRATKAKAKDPSPTSLSDLMGGG